MAAPVADSSRRPRLALDDHLVGDAVDLGQQDVHHLFARRGHVLADVVGADGQLAVAAVDEHREAHRRRPAAVHQRIHGRAHGAPRVEHVVDHHDGGGGEVERQLRALELRAALQRGAVIAEEGDVERAHRDGHALVGLDGLGDASRQRHATALDTHQCQVVRAAVLLDDLVADAHQRSAHLVGGHDLASAHAALPPRRAHGAGA